MSATQAWPNVAEVLCQSKYNFESYSIFGDDRFVVSPCTKWQMERFLWKRNCISGAWLKSEILLFVQGKTIEKCCFIQLQNCYCIQAIATVTEHCLKNWCFTSNRLLLMIWFSKRAMSLSSGLSWSGSTSKLPGLRFTCFSNLKNKIVLKYFLKTLKQEIARLKMLTR